MGSVQLLKRKTRWRHSTSDAAAGPDALGKRVWQRLRFSKSAASGVVDEGPQAVSLIADGTAPTPIPAVPKNVLWGPRLAKTDED